MLGAALAVWLSLGRPLFFKQRRVGRDGREFEMLKLRTMRAPEGNDGAGSSWRRARPPEESKASTAGRR